MDEVMSWVVFSKAVFGAAVAYLIYRSRRGG